MATGSRQDPPTIMLSSLGNMATGSRDNIYDRWLATTSATIQVLGLLEKRKALCLFLNGANVLLTVELFAYS